MKRNSFIKTFMRIFALLASIGGVIFLFRDKILSYPKLRNYMESHPDCPLCSKLKQHLPDQKEDTLDDEDEDFEHAFDEDPTTAREYVSLNINPHVAIDNDDTKSQPQE